VVAARQQGNLTPVGTGEAIDKLTNDWLASYMNDHYRAMLGEPLDVNVGDGTGAGGGELGAAIGAKAREAYDRLRHIWTYRQYRAMAASLWDDFAEDHSDCSSFATLVYKDAGAPDPNYLDQPGRSYDGYGYTGTLWPNGTPCDPKPGALAFYGGSSGNDTTHVAVCDTATSVVSFGSTPITRYTTVAYRGDYRGCRSYV
jgi:hypothetical protein